jgi:hypothetical protein
MLRWFRRGHGGLGGGGVPAQPGSKGSEGGVGVARPGPGTVRLAFFSFRGAMGELCAVRRVLREAPVRVLWR